MMGKIRSKSHGLKFSSKSFRRENENPETNKMDVPNKLCKSTEIDVSMGHHLEKESAK
jgi:hypothetical protein